MSARPLSLKLKFGAWCHDIFVRPTDRRAIRHRVIGLYDIATDEPVAICGAACGADVFPIADSELDDAPVSEKKCHKCQSITCGDGRGLPPMAAALFLQSRDWIHAHGKESVWPNTVRYAVKR